VTNYASSHASTRDNEISPELVLVDPELARVARTKLLLEAENKAALRRASVELEDKPDQSVIGPPYHQLLTPPIVVANGARHEGRSAPKLSRSSRVLSFAAPSILTVSLLLNLMLAGVLLGGAGEGPSLEPATVSPTSASTTQEGRGIASTTAPGRGRANRRASNPSVRKRTTHDNASRRKAAAERAVLALVQAAPRSRLTPLIDQTSGLLKNNVQAVCRRHAGGGHLRFLCVVRAAGAAAGEGLYLTYALAPRGQWSVTWLGYRKGRAGR
jgi:hypothetical protein